MTYTCLEIRTTLTALGIRFWDAVFDRVVTDDLVVTARPRAAGRPVIRAFRTGSGVYAFQGLPGLEAVEYPEGDPSLPASLPPSRVYIIAVTDRQQRFLPVAFEETLPLPYLGIFPGSAPGSLPEESPPGFYLFSSPSRPVASGLAAVRAYLVDQVSGGPAAHAVLTVQAGDDDPLYGLTDAQGQVVVLFPYPTFAINLSTSPPSGPSPSQQVWPLTIRVYYRPENQRSLGPVSVPDFRTIMGQPPALIYPTDDPADSPLESWPAELLFGRELVLRTAGLATLLVSPVASLP